MPDTKPTPTVVDSDRKIARTWYRTGRGISIGSVTDMMAEIAAAREAWGVPREVFQAATQITDR